MAHHETVQDLPMACHADHTDKKEQAHWESVCRAFQQYATFAMCQRINQRDRLAALPESQRQYLPRGLQKDTPEAQKRAIQYKEAAIRNQFCLDCILRHAGMPHSQEVLAEASVCSSEGNMSKISSVLKSLARDWSMEGKAERDMAYQPLLQNIQRYVSPNRTSGPAPKLCVPGAGVGRLALELSALGYSVQGNEFSLYMLLASDFVLNGGICAPDRPLAISPWLLETRNVHGSEDPCRFMTIPDVNPYNILSSGPNQTTREFSMAAGEFASIYSNPNEHGQWDGIVSCFFLDAAPSMIEYLQIMHTMLREGGVLINFGPLLHHWSGPAMRPDDQTPEQYKRRYHYLDQRYMTSVDLCWEDVREILTNIGFAIEEEKVGIHALYTADRKSMMNMSYRCVYFVARKVRPAGR